MTAERSPSQDAPVPPRQAQDRPRLALVTGGHRRLGAVIATALADRGYALAVHGSSNCDLDAGLADAIARNGTPWHGFTADFAQAGAAQGLMAAVIDRFGMAPDLLVNNAAIFGQDRLDDVTADALVQHYAVNCVAPALLTSAFAAAATDRPGRAIVNILDQRIANPHGDQLSYTLSKIALAGLTAITARELAPHIRVNAVAPGLTIKTADYSAAQMQRLEGMMPLHALPLPHQIAEAVLYLADAGAMTGQTLHVDGGAHMHSFARDFMHL